MTARRTAAVPVRAVVSEPSGTAAGSSSREVLQLFRRPFLSEEAAATLARKANAKAAVGGAVESITTEQCFNVEVTSPLTADELATLQWLLRETFEPDLFTEATQLTVGHRRKNSENSSEFLLTHDTD